jgi:hypothetical protein
VASPGEHRTALVVAKFAPEILPVAVTLPLADTLPVAETGPWSTSGRGAEVVKVVEWSQENTLKVGWSSEAREGGVRSTQRRRHKTRCRDWDEVSR